jgi:hypothetical protein
VAKRRSLDDALTPEVEAFLKTGKPAAKATNPKPKPKPKKKEEQPTMTRSALKEEFIPNAAPQSANPRQQAGAATMGSVNARVDPAIAEALMLASVQRRIQRATISTHREIVAEALTDWLKKYGYLK